MSTIIQPMLYEQSKVGLPCSYIIGCCQCWAHQYQAGKEAHIKAQNCFHEPWKIDGSIILLYLLRWHVVTLQYVNNIPLISYDGIYYNYIVELCSENKPLNKDEGEH